VIAGEDALEKRLREGPEPEDVCYTGLTLID